MSAHDEPTTEGQVVYLPNAHLADHGQDQEHEQPAPQASGQVLEGELVTDAEYRRLTSEKDKALDRWAGYRADVVTMARTARTVATHERTKVAGKAVARHGSYVVLGAGIAARRLWEARSNARPERMMRAAEAAQDFERVADWHDRAERAKQSRHQRRMDWVELPLRVAKGSVIGLLTLLGLLGVLGVMMAVADGDPSAFVDPFVGTFTAVKWTILLVIGGWAVILSAAVAGGLAILHTLGRRGATPPAWVQPASARVVSEGAPVTPSAVITALRDLGLAPLKQKINDSADAGAEFLGPITIAGCGVEVDVTLPRGSVSTLDVQNRRRKIAENLDRHEHEVFISIPPAPRTVRFWIADPGALDEPIGDSPMVLDPDMSADLYTGRAPWGQDLRGDAVALSLLQKHLLITGLSNQGKTAALRALALWLALDPTTEQRIADLKGVGDWRMFDGLATRLIQGPTDEHVIAAAEMLEAGVAEMEDRIRRLEASGATDGVTRDMARKPGSGFHSLHLIVDEAQVAFMCPAKDEAGQPYGGTKATSRYFMAARKLHNQGRAVNVHLWQGTQDPTDQNLPKLVREGAHIRASLVVGTEAQARMALGDKAVNGGAAPHKLRTGADKGTVVITGEGVPLTSGQPALTVRTHFVSGEDAAELAERAKARRGGHAATTTEEQPRDLLADVATVLGSRDAVRATDVVTGLRELAPGYGPYTALTAERLAAQLGEAGVPVRSKDGYLTVRAQRVHAALADREESEPS